MILVKTNKTLLKEEIEDLIARTKKNRKFRLHRTLVGNWEAEAMADVWSSHCAGYGFLGFETKIKKIGRGKYEFYVGGLRKDLVNFLIDGWREESSEIVIRGLISGKIKKEDIKIL